MTNYVVEYLQQFVTIEYYDSGSNKPNYDIVQLALFFELVEEQQVPKFIGIPAEFINKSFFRVVSVNEFDSLYGFTFFDKDLNILLSKHDESAGDTFIPLRKLCDYKDDINKYKSSDLRSRNSFNDRMIYKYPNNPV